MAKVNLKNSDSGLVFELDVKDWEKIKGKPQAAKLSETTEAPTSTGVPDTVTAVSKE